MDIENDFKGFDVYSLGLIILELMIGNELPKNVSYLL